jgi:hypothetical protein
MSAHAEVRYWRERPKFPAAAPRTNSQNWTASGRSKPMAVRKLATSAAVASFGSITMAGSPVRRTMKKTRARTHATARTD